VQHRNIACVVRADEFIALPARNCSDTKPTTEQICRMPACSSEWFISDWSAVRYRICVFPLHEGIFLSREFPRHGCSRVGAIVFCLQCSVTCGVGVQTRLVRCIVEGVSSSSCLETDKPVAQQRCNAEPCRKEAPRAKELASKPSKSKQIVHYLIEYSVNIELQTTVSSSNIFERLQTSFSITLDVVFQRCATNRPSVWTNI